MAVFSIPGVVMASRLQSPPPPAVSSGIPALDAHTGGLPRGALTEICGPASSGRTSLLLAALAAAASRQELCALVDASDSFDPYSAAAAGVPLDRLLWIRCGQTPLHARFWFGRVEQALKATDLLLQGGGFGLVAVDLADVPREIARRVPLASWFRYRRAVEHTSTILLVLEPEPYAKTCASLVLRTTLRSARRRATVCSTLPSHAQLFLGSAVEVELVRAWEQKKPPKSVRIVLNPEAKWTGVAPPPPAASPVDPTQQRM